MNNQQVVDTAVLAGEIMLMNGAETYRVEETIEYILNTTDAEQIDAFVIPTGIMVSVKPAGEEVISVIRRVKDRQNNLRKVVAVNDISRKICDGTLEIPEAYRQLQHVEEYWTSQAFYNLCLVGVAGSFAMLFGGGPSEIFVAAINGVLLALVNLFNKRVKMNSFFEDVLAAAVITAATILCRVIFPFPIDADIVIISSIMPLVPGVAITNAIRDTMQKDYLAGVTRATEAALKATAIATGVVVGIALFGNMAGGGIL